MYAAAIERDVRQAGGISAAAARPPPQLSATIGSVRSITRAFCTARPPLSIPRLNVGAGLPTDAMKECDIIPVAHAL